MFEPIRIYLPSIRSKTTKIDGWVFRLYHRATVVVLIFASFLVGSKQLFGEPIRCTCDDGLLPVDFISTYCLTKGTFTVTELVDDDSLQEEEEEEVANPGVGYCGERVHTKIYHRYYQWVALFFIVTAVSFYVPRSLWKHLERRTMEALTGDHLLLKLRPGERRTKEHDEALLRWLALVCNHFKRERVGSDLYLIKYLLLQLINPLIVLLQVYLTDLFLNGRFLSLGPDVLRYSNNNNNNNNSSRDFVVDGSHKTVHPLELAFPKVAACTYKKNGGLPSSSGESTKSVDAVCVLPLNNLNEKLFVLLWFWYAFLLTASAIQILLAVVTKVPRCSRRLSLAKSILWGLLKQVRTIALHLSLGQLFQLLLIRKNVTREQFDILVEALGESLAAGPAAEAKMETEVEMEGGVGGRGFMVKVSREGPKGVIVWRVLTEEMEDEMLKTVEEKEEEMRDEMYGMYS